MASDSETDAAHGREALLRAARTLFADKGFARTSVADIVDSAGTSVGLLYYHFGNKEQIFVALWQEYYDAQIRATRGAVARARAAGESDGGQLLMAGMRAYLQGTWASREIISMLHLQDTPPNFQPILQRATLNWLRQNRVLLAEMDPVVAKGTTSVVMAGLGAVQRDLGHCKTDRDAHVVIDCGLQLLGAVVDTARTMGSANRTGTSAAL